MNPIASFAQDDVESLLHQYGVADIVYGTTTTTTMTTTTTQPNGSTTTTTTQTTTSTGDDSLDALLREADQIYENSKSVTRTTPAMTKPATPTTTANPAAMNPVTTKPAAMTTVAKPAATNPVASNPASTNPVASNHATTTPVAATTFVQSRTSYYALLSEYEKKLYESVYQAVKECQRRIVVAGDLEETTMSNVMSAVTNDHPEFVWMSESYTHEKTMVNDRVEQTEILFSYNSLANSPTQSVQAFESISRGILEEARKQGSKLAMEKYIHDYLVQNVQYQRNGVDQSAYSAIVSRQTVCAGFARAFKYFMDQLGIPTYVVSGQLEGGEHSWNLVNLDGRWYNVDVTSDSIEIHEAGGVYKQTDYRLFNKSDREFRAMGYVRESEYLASGVRLPSCDD